MTDALTEAKAARAELHASGVWPTYGNVPGNHIYNCGKHLDAAIAALAPPPPPPPGGWAAIYAETPPPFTPARTVTAASPSDLNAKINSALPGDLIRYTGTSAITGEFTVKRNLLSLFTAVAHPIRHLTHRRANGAVGPRAVVDFNMAKLTGTAAGSQLPNFFLQKAGGIRFQNFEIAGGGGDGLRVEDSMGALEFWGFRIHNTAAQGIHLYGVTRDCAGVLLHGECFNNGLDLSQDPHPEKGTGLHTFYSGGSPRSVTNGDWTLWVHDQPHGAAMQIDRTRNTRIRLKADNITFVAHSQVGGNALQLWSYQETATVWNDSIVVEYVEGNNVARVVETNGMESGTLANSKVVKGRSSHVRLSPAYATHAGMQFIDCT